MLNSKLKKLSAALLAACFLPAASAFAGDDIKIHADGVIVDTEFAPFIENGYTYLAVRTMGDIVSAEDIEWNGEERSVTMTSGDMEVKLTVGSDKIYADGALLYADAAPTIRDDRAYLPLRVVSNAFGAEVRWDGGTKTVFINTGGETEADTELEWLSRIVYAEAGAESYEGKIAVANVVLNRVKSKDFPDTIYGVVFDKYNDIYQFTPVKNGYIYSVPNEESIRAAKAALGGENNVENCLYFVATAEAANSWAGKNREFYATIGGHSFYR